MGSKTLSRKNIDIASDPRIQDHWVKTEWNAIEKLSPFPKHLSQIAILSHADDEGIRLNNGRPGASDGPERLLYYFGRMVHRAEKTPPILVVTDQSRHVDLDRRHEEAYARVSKLLALNCRVVTLGGGHDYGFPDACAYYEQFKGKILNIDAHLDVRPVVDGRLNSGTPFFRFIEKFGGKALIEWGIQEQCNAISHLTFAQESGAKVLSYTKPLPKISGAVGLSVCLDAFEGIRGVSAPAMVGLRAQDGIDAVDTYRKRSRWLGIYECAPKYDPLNEDSARLGALLAYRFIHL
jgi:formiminoglutamase